MFKLEVNLCLDKKSLMKLAQYTEMLNRDVYVMTGECINIEIDGSLIKVIYTTTLMNVYHYSNANIAAI